jgi:hypothetical protein
MKTLILAAIRCSLMFTSVAALSLAYPASVQAVPTTYQYTGKPFTRVSGPYTTSDFVTAMITLASPLPPTTATTVTPLDFTISDGVQTITRPTISSYFFSFETDGAGTITHWVILVSTPHGFINLYFVNSAVVSDRARASRVPHPGFGERNAHGSWTATVSAPDAGSSLALLSLSLTALGVAARQFKRAAA